MKVWIYEMKLKFMEWKFEYIEWKSEYVEWNFNLWNESLNEIFQSHQTMSNPRLSFFHVSDTKNTVLTTHN